MRQQKNKFQKLDTHFFAPNPPAGNEPDIVAGSDSGPTITLRDYRFTSTIYETDTQRCVR